MPALHGIDVSHSNLLNHGPIDWRAVATTTPALEFVMARMTHGGHGDDDLRVDRQALNNQRGMRANFPDAARGYYHFLGTSTPAVQAAHFAKVTGPLRPGEFVMLDVEPDEPAKVPVLSVTQIVETLEAIEHEFGVLPGLYIGRFYSGSLDTRLWRFPLFLPAYTSETTYKALAASMGRPVAVWQWGGGTNGATVPGITGRIDSNRIENERLFRSTLKRDAPPKQTDPPVHVETTPPTKTPQAPVRVPIPPPEEDGMDYGPYLIQATGKDGNPAGTVYACDRRFMTVRRIPDEQALAGYRWQLREAGAKAPELADGAPILPVDTVAAFGTIIG